MQYHDCVCEGWLSCLLPIVKYMSICRCPVRMSSCFHFLSRCFLRVHKAVYASACVAATKVYQTYCSFKLFSCTLCRQIGSRLVYSQRTKSWGHVGSVAWYTVPLYYRTGVLYVRVSPSASLASIVCLYVLAPCVPGMLTSTAQYRFPEHWNADITPIFNNSCQSILSRLWHLLFISRLPFPASTVPVLLHSSVFSDWLWFTILLCCDWQV